MQIYISKHGVAIPIIQTVHTRIVCWTACMYMGPVYILKLLISLHAN